MDSGHNLVGLKGHGGLLAGRQDVDGTQLLEDGLVFFAMGVVNLPAAFMETGLAPRATARPTATAPGPSLGTVALPAVAVAGAARPMAFTACWPRAVRAFAKSTVGVEPVGGTVEGGRDAVPVIGARETTSAA